MSLRQFVHGVYVALPKDGAIVANLKDVKTNESTLAIIERPQRPLWVTKPQLRNHSLKKEFAPEAELDMHIVPQDQLAEGIFKAIHGFNPTRYINLRHQMQSPYVYGADIDVRLILKKSLADKCKGEYPTVYHTSFLDIETDVVHNTGRIIAMSFVDCRTKQIFSAFEQSYAKVKDSEEQVRSTFDKELDKLVDQLKPTAKKVFTAKDYKLHTKACNSELELILWIFKNLHICKPDFCGIWGINFDAPRLEQRLEILGVDPASVFCHPDVPAKYRYFNYKPSIEKPGSKGKKHFAERWHWLAVAGYTQFYCAMALFARLRKAKGMLPSYKLDYVAGYMIGAGKLDFGGADHYIMQTTRFIEYVVYNIFDVLLIDIMERLGKNVLQLMALTTTSLIDSFAKQTVMSRDFFYFHCRNRRRVPAATAGSLEVTGDEDIENVGGNVLSPFLVKNTAIPILQETPIIKGMHKFVADLDATALYPSIMREFNISRETKLATVISMQGRPPSAIEDFFERVVSPSMNAVSLCSQYFNLPNYQDMHNLFNGLPIDENRFSGGGPIGWSKKAEEGYEVSTKGDKRFSALIAKLADGRTIEEAYQLDVKGFREITSDWTEGKGKPPLNGISRDALWQGYIDLWRQWSNENPNVISELYELSSGLTLTDVFATSEISQARALFEIITEWKITGVFEQQHSDETDEEPSNE